MANYDGVTDETYTVRGKVYVRKITKKGVQSWVL